MLRMSPYYLTLNLVNCIILDTRYVRKFSDDGTKKQKGHDNKDDQEQAGWTTSQTGPTGKERH